MRPPNISIFSIFWSKDKCVCPAKNTVKCLVQFCFEQITYSSPRVIYIGIDILYQCLTIIRDFIKTLNYTLTVYGKWVLYVFTWVPMLPFNIISEFIIGDNINLCRTVMRLIIFTRNYKNVRNQLFYALLKVDYFKEQIILWYFYIYCNNIHIALETMQQIASIGIHIYISSIIIPALQHYVLIHMMSSMREV